MVGFSLRDGEPQHTFVCTTQAYAPNDLFNYSSGRWLVNNDLRLAERRREFDVNELCRRAAQSVGRTSQDIDTFVKLAEGGFNRTFLITMHGGFEMVARIPYPVTVSKLYAIASEVATMRFLRSSGLPVPEVYDYSPSSDNVAKTEYIFMELIRGTKLSDVWMELEEPDIVSVLRQPVQLESRMMLIPFPAGGSLYYTNDLEKVEGVHTIDENAKAVLVAAALKELAYLEKFGRPLLPFQRGRREAYGYKGQSPSDHIKNLERYLVIAPSLASKDSALHHFRSPAEQHHRCLQNYDDPVSQALTPPSLPANMDKLDQSEHSHAMGLYHRGLVHFHYVKNTEQYNKLHHDALSDLVSMFIYRLFNQAGAPWEGETHALKTTLIEAMEMWGMLTGEGVPCPVAFEPEDLRKTKELSAKLQVADENFEGC
ncbi:hypothetical protein SERLADRAFT_449647 [Serpula lacrymans var. lacrymans S7.9]|uniref:Uncharacterized protein n=1 Tax=Serpula lacrymans var. lacrymans (strain S7.9) TaxID=578457 RepID=F8NVY3_SERL9|nr:uncharacterized protein SERLADRAFT_449647 [Serpula lacrymans var. lacrymans S7.9]EGO24917.1 hypothetical protein SERLADRAFT_449647 [Serpula lacrymans var. lacrymans S7.9]